MLRILIYVPAFVSLACAQSQLLQERAKPACSGTIKSPSPPGLICNETGTASNTVLVIGATYLKTQTACLDSCLSFHPECVSFAYGPGQRCELYNKKIIRSEFKKGNTGKTFWNHNCYTSTCTCPNSKTACYNRCVNLLPDSANCNKCGRYCQDYADCTNGKCICDSNHPTKCSGQCVDTTSDFNHCGACGTVCTTPTDGGCYDSLCQCNPSNQLECDPGVCTDPAFDSSNCGSCGTVCPDGTTCYYSKCS